MDQFKCEKLEWKCSAVKSISDASKQLTLKFKVPIEDNNKKHFQEVQLKKHLNAFVLWSFEFDNSYLKKISKTTDFISKIQKGCIIFACKVNQDKTCLQSFT